MFDCVVIGAGFYGCSISKALLDRGKTVLLIDSEDSVLKKASFNNQARVHGGYHYPRSYLTARRSRANFDKFLKNYPSAIVKDFNNIYGIARNFSNISSLQFKEFCKRIESPLVTVPANIRGLFNEDLVEEVFLVEEFAFDSKKLAEYCLSSLDKKNIKIVLNSPALSVSQSDDGILKVQIDFQKECKEWVSTKAVYVCTYSKINVFLAASALPITHLKHELTEMALILPPEELKNVGITIMDGPFWSMMPFPSLGFHTLSHVRYTPHRNWEDTKENVQLLDINKINKTTNYTKMKADAARFISCLEGAKYSDSLWEVKTILPRSDGNDSRPILFKKDYGLKNLNLVLGGKIDNIFDILKEL